MHDWNEADDPPKDVKELWDRLNRLERSLADIEIIKGKRVTGGAAGTRIPHGRPGHVPKDAYARWAPGLGGSPTPFVTELTDTHVLVVASADLFVNLVVFF